jgi:hypothetical protein
MVEGYDDVYEDDDYLWKRDKHRTYRRNELRDLVPYKFVSSDDSS